MERGALLRDVWGYEYAGGSNVIEANVRSLRRETVRARSKPFEDSATASVCRL